LLSAATMAARICRIVTLYVCYTSLKQGFGTQNSLFSWRSGVTNLSDNNKDTECGKMMGRCCKKKTISSDLESVYTHSGILII